MVWQTNVSKTEILNQTPDWVGTTFRETIEENGKSTVMQGVVTDYRENQSLAMHISGQYNTVDVGWYVKTEGDHVLLTASSDIRFKSFLKLVSIILGPVFKKNLTKQLQEEFAKLKELCEKDS